jgi:hypothetical protein
VLRGKYQIVKSGSSVSRSKSEARHSNYNVETKVLKEEKKKHKHVLIPEEKIDPHNLCDTKQLHFPEGDGTVLFPPLQPSPPSNQPCDTKQLHFPEGDGTVLSFPVPWIWSST